ncbi:glutathione-dependent formaldehyde-activating protein [Rhizorhabdus wittichii DC-6]|nr:glutathione-dependent formaldehyde-activating protein [Rhizorhabdus wittichii DC-6]
MTAGDASRTGGCLCGRIRYRLASAPFDPGYCHCRMCQRFGGAPVMAFASVPLVDFHVEAGDPVRYRSSEIGERWFCRDCGSSLAMRVDRAPGLIDVTMATLDDPTWLPPAFHIWRESRIGWFDTIDALPRHERERPRAVAPSPAVAGLPLPS